MAKLKITETATVDVGQASGFGGTGGLPSTITSTGPKTIDIAYKTSANAAVTHGYIISQKGSRKFLCANSAVGDDTTDLTTVVLTNKAAAACDAGEGSLVCYDTTGNVFYASRVTTKHVYDWNGNKYIYKVDVPATVSYANVASY